jgi:hypothetical protein
MTQQRSGSWGTAFRGWLGGRAWFSAMAESVGRVRLVDIVLLIGLYSATCALINAFEIPTPEV